MTTSEIKTNRCSNCYKDLDRATSIKEDAVPSTGSISICWTCGQVCVFNDDMTLRNITHEEIKLLAVEDPSAFYQIIKSVSLINSRNKSN